MHLFVRDAIDVLPKRIDPLRLEDGKREIFWGIYARERRSFARIATYGLLANLPSIVFFFLWLLQWKHASDLNAAAVPFVLTMSLLALALVLLLESREQDHI